MAMLIDTGGVQTGVAVLNAAGHAKEAAVKPLIFGTEGQRRRDTDR